MKIKQTFALSSLVLAMGFSAHAQDALTETKEASVIEKNKEATEEITIVGVRQDRVSQGATGLNLELNETPQSISVISDEQIKNFAANDLNDALKLATGITVEEWETNRTNYTARGFDIKSTQIDGVGMPNNWGIVTGSVESYGYEKIEVIRGANGLLTGVGNSAGTINYVRKRPTNETEGEVGLTLGSWDSKRLQADASILLTESGSWAARVVAVTEESASYLDGLEDERTYFSAVVDGQLTDNSTLAAGLSYQKSDTDGNMWGGLVFNYSDGTQAEWDVSSTTAQEWTSWDVETTTAFIEYAYTFNNDWEFKGTYNRQASEDPAKLFYVYGAIDKDTGLGLYGWPGQYEDNFSADLIDLSLVGDYSVFGQSHEFSLGVSSSKSETKSYRNDPLSGFDPTPAFPYALDAIPEPEWSEQTQYANIELTLNRFFGSTKVNLSQDLFVVAGFNAIEFSREGLNDGIIIDNEESEISPYIGATYSISDNINAYVSYSDIYQPQEQYDIDGYFLAPTKGINYELGVKTNWFDNRLLTTVAIFTAEQDNLSAFDGIDENGQYYYKGINVESQGFEFELVGQITDNLNAVFGYTYVDIEDDAGMPAHQWNPDNAINFSIDYTFPVLADLVVGLGGKWQSETKNVDYAVEQDSYLIVNAFARLNITEQLDIQANVNNITDEKYINSLYNVGYYGAPINGSVSINYSF